MTEKYRRTPGTVLHAGTREVLVDGDGVHFHCPCGERMVYAGESAPYHRLRHRRLADAGPVLQHRKNSEYPAGWCHFWLRDGVTEMVTSAQCPGSAA